MGGKLISSDEATPATGQHTQPCFDCPFARTALPGWLGALSPEEWMQRAHGESWIECHVHTGVYCAGAAIYRANVGKMPRDPDHLKLPEDRNKVFTGQLEFLHYHSKLGDE